MPIGFEPDKNINIQKTLSNNTVKLGNKEKISSTYDLEAHEDFFTPTDTQPKTKTEYNSRLSPHYKASNQQQLLENMGNYYAYTRPNEYFFKTKEDHPERDARELKENTENATKNVKNKLKNDSVPISINDLNKFLNLYNKNKGSLNSWLTFWEDSSVILLKNNKGLGKCQLNEKYMNEIVGLVQKRLDRANYNVANYDSISNKILSNNVFSTGNQQVDALLLIDSMDKPTQGIILRELADKKITDLSIKKMSYLSKETGDIINLFLIGGKSKDGKYYYFDPITVKNNAGTIRNYSGQNSDEAFNDYLSSGKECLPDGKISYLNTNGSKSTADISHTVENAINTALNIISIGLILASPWTGNISGIAGTGLRVFCGGLVLYNLGSSGFTIYDKSTHGEFTKKDILAPTSIVLSSMIFRGNAALATRILGNIGLSTDAIIKLKDYEAELNKNSSLSIDQKEREFSKALTQTLVSIGVNVIVSKMDIKNASPKVEVASIKMKQKSGTFDKSLTEKDVYNRNKVSMRTIEHNENLLIGVKEGVQASKPNGKKFNIPKEHVGSLETLSKDAIQNNKYLWVIDKGELKIVREETPFPTARKKVSHTNLTGGGKAYAGGEVWFLSENKVKINARSGAYGRSWRNTGKTKTDETTVDSLQDYSISLTEYEYKQAIKFWKSLGYEVETEPLMKLEKGIGTDIFDGGKVYEINPNGTKTPLNKKSE